MTSTRIPYILILYMSPAVLPLMFLDSKSNISVIPNSHVRYAVIIWTSDDQEHWCLLLCGENNCWSHYCMLLPMSQNY